MKKFLSHEIFYTHAVTDVTDNYQVWFSALSYFFGDWGTFDLQHRDSHTLARGVAVGVRLLAHLSDGLSAVLNFVGVDDGVANSPSNVPLVGVGDVLALLHRLRDTIGVANRLDGLGDAGVV